MTDQPVLTVLEYARQERISRWTVYRLIWSGQLPAKRAGRRKWLILAAA